MTTASWHLIGRVVPDSYTYRKQRCESVLKALPKSIAPENYVDSATGVSFALMIVDGPQMDPSLFKTANYNQHQPINKTPAHGVLRGVPAGQKSGSFCLPPTGRLTVANLLQRR